MSDWQIRDTETGQTWAKDSRAECESAIEEFSDMDLEIVEPDTDGGTKVVEQPQVKEEQALEELGESLGTDPLSILPDHMKDTIKGQPAVNKRGYAMIAERYDIEVSANIREFPWENEEGRAVAHATAWTEDGKEYSGWATASAKDGDMEDQLIELAETRSLKRAVSWASGVGIVSYVEMTDQL